ncbi:MAG: lipopolysaccharide assembly protein LapB [Gammaproteobacteria bacterium]|nr:MAG: lipopolysaccharide assembly protein LapB [Gammaproteobacteria bacterium]
MADLNYLFLLLLPVAAASGWFAASKKSYSSKARDSGRLSSEYFKGLNYLLNEQQDKAIEVFLHMAEVDNETVETHFALGNLFGRRGEVDRAIRIHQNLIARDTLTVDQRAQALQALAEDYMRAGLFDRAEDLFKELTQCCESHPRALRHLIDIYEQEKDWISAVEATRELARQTGGNFDSVMAQYYCELAEQATERGDKSAAMRNLDRALTTDPKCVRASILYGSLYEEAGEFAKAIDVYKQVEEQDIEYVPEVIDGLLGCYEKLDKPYDVMPYLADLVQKSSGLSAMLALADLIQRRDGDEEAEFFITEQLRRRPSVMGLDQLIRVHMKNSDQVARENLKILLDLTQKLLTNKPNYLCVKCGFKGRSLHWQCPGCKRWHTMKPVHGVEGE